MVNPASPEHLDFGQAHLPLLLWRAAVQSAASTGRETRERRAPRPFIAESSNACNRRSAVEREAAGLPPLHPKISTGPASSAAPQQPTLPPAAAAAPSTTAAPGGSFQIKLTDDVVHKTTLAVPAELMRACCARDSATPCQLVLPRGLCLDSILHRGNTACAEWRSGTLTMGLSAALGHLQLTGGSTLHICVSNDRGLRLHLASVAAVAAEGRAVTVSEPQEPLLWHGGVPSERAAAAAEADAAAHTPGWFTLPPLVMTAASGASLRIPRGILQHWDVHVPAVDCVMVLPGGWTFPSTIKIDESTGEAMPHSLLCLKSMRMAVSFWPWETSILIVVVKLACIIPTGTESLYFEAAFLVLLTLNDPVSS